MFKKRTEEVVAQPESTVTFYDISTMHPELDEYRYYSNGTLQNYTDYISYTCKSLRDDRYKIGVRVWESGLVDIYPEEPGINLYKYAYYDGDVTYGDEMSVLHCCDWLNNIDIFTGVPNLGDYDNYSVYKAVRVPAYANLVDVSNSFEAVMESAFMNCKIEQLYLPHSSTPASNGM